MIHPWFASKLLQGSPLIISIDLDPGCDINQKYNPIYSNKQM